MKRVLTGSAILIVGFLVTTGTGVELDKEEDQQQVEALIAAVCQASRPVDSMRIQWTWESGKIPPVSRRKTLPEDPTGGSRKTCTVITKGLQSRYEYLQRSYRDSTEPYDVRQRISVFDGTKQRFLVTRIKGARDGTRGTQGVSDRNSGLIASELFGWPVNFNDPKQLASLAFELGESSDPGIYVLEALRQYGDRLRFIIDSGKGFNLTQIRRIRSDGTTDYETNFRLKQYDDGLWYVAERERYRHFRDGEVKLEHSVKVTKAEFNIEVPDETFVLDFPEGTAVWDEILGNWFRAGAPKEPIIENEVSDVVKMLIDPVEDQTTTKKLKQPGDVSGMSERGQEQTADAPGTEAPPGHRKLLWLLVAAVGMILVVLIIRSVRARRKR